MTGDHQGARMGERIIGIDLGTTNSGVAVLEGHTPIMIPNKGGYKTTPSVVAITAGGKRLVGHLAKRQALTNPLNTVSAAKRLIGRAWSSPITKQLAETCSYTLVEGPMSEVRVELHGRAYSVAELSSMVLLELKAAAEAYLGEPVSKAVITVPAYFNDAQRAATREAGQLAGLDVVRMINEPTAAALAYGYGKEMNRVVAIYDLGGGTFDFSVLEISGGVFEVLATSGDTFLGGEDFDDRIILQWLVLEFAQEHRVDLRRDKMAMQRLKEAAEKAKCELSNARSAELNLPFLISRADGETLHLQRVLTRAKLEELTSDLVDRTLGLCEQTLREAKVQVDDVILVGGMTRMPLIQERVKAFFKRAPRRDVHPDEVVALGAALQGHSLSAGASSQLLLLDVTPMSLGIMISEGQFNALIPKNTTIPTSKSHIFTTVRDYQTTVRILVLQGESEDATDNDLLGEFSLEGLRAALKGEVEVEVTFSISADGLVSVSAKDLETGREQAITVTAKSNLTPAELKAMAAENQEHLVELRAQEKVEHLRLRLDRTLRSMDNMMPRVKTLLSNNELASEALTKAEQVIERARSSLSAPLSQDLQGDLERLERDHKALTRTLNMFHNVIEKMKR